MPDLPHDFEDDIWRVQSIEQVPLILDVCTRTTGMRFAAVARVTEDRWITCASRDEIAFGLTPGDELEVQTTICNEIRAGGELVTIDDVAADDTYRTHHTPLQYGFRSYISVPIVRGDGSFFGTLCAIDPEPRHVSAAETVGMFELFADLIASQLDASDELNRSRADLLNERNTARLREEFIAIVGHDLRNPLASLWSGLRRLGAMRLPDESAWMLREMQKSVMRMNSIVDNLLDFARGRLGTGIEAEIVEGVDLEATIDTVVSELESVDQREVVREFDLPWTVPCDPQRMGQLVSNLVSNAFTHGTSDAAVRIVADGRGDHLRIAVSNQGDPIPEEVIPSLFQPFHRRGNTPSRSGVGLGLYIASEIAAAHGGTLTVHSTEEATTFTFEMPLPPRHSDRPPAPVPVRTSDPRP